MVFNAGSKKVVNKNFNFKLNNDLIPTCESIKFLVLTFDIGLNFNEHVKEILKKCNNRLNVIKILSNKKWRLNKTTLTTIYLALIRSMIDYSSLIMPHLAKTLTRTIQSVQNTAFKCIYKLDYKTSTEEVDKSSANKFEKVVYFLNFVSLKIMSFIKILNNIGLRTPPLGTPVSI